jgi:glycosyltransferase involved in cell wall biosynthesis
MIMPKVTAIVSAYYAKRFIASRLANLMEQTLVPEIIVVCQAGSDEESVARKCCGARTILTPGIPTIYDAWNIGIAKATGEYICNANSDDLYAPDGIEEMANALDEHRDCAVVYGDCWRAEKYQDSAVGRMNRRTGGYPELLAGYFVGPMPMWRKSLHEKYGVFDDQMRICGDYEFFLRIAAYGEKFYRLDRIVGTYLRRADSAEHANPILLKMETKLVQERYGKAVTA